MKLKDLKHPMQPIGWDGDVIRFKKNKIVRFLLDTSKFSLNDFSKMLQEDIFSVDDYTHLMQLIGYSVSGYGELSTSPIELVTKADEAASLLVLKRKSS